MKYILSFPIILFPYTIIGAIYCITSGFLMESLFQNTVYSLFLWIILFALIAHGITLVMSAFFLIKKSNARNIAKLNMIVKLSQILAYIGIFIVGVICLISVWGILLVIWFVVFNVWSITMTGTIGSVAVYRSYQEGKISKKMSVVYALCQFIFCLDIVACIMLYRETKKI